MNNTKFKEKLFGILKKEEKLWNEDKTELNQTLLLDIIENFNDKNIEIYESIIKMFLEDEDIKKKFFIKIKDVYVFKTNDFKFFMEENRVYNSFTQYKNRIGLTDGKRFLKDSADVVLNFPYKDCILEGGQSSEDGLDNYYEYDEKVTKTDEKKGFKAESYNLKQSKRNEVFFNQVLAKDEIDRLFDKKAFINWKRFNKDGETSIDKIKRDEDGTIKENLIIKGNNLLALHSLESQFKGQVKLIYIDPPYNTGSDSFAYNDRFNHSTWLTFMKNRLEVAKKLLKEDGMICIQLDHHEFGYLNVLMDEIFGIENKVQQVSVKVASPSGFKAVNPGPIDVLENILIYSKNKKSINFKKNYVISSYHKNYNKYLDSSSDNISDWKLLSLKEKVLTENGFSNEKSMSKELGSGYKFILQELIADFAFKNSNNVVSIRDLHKPTKQVKELQDKSKIERDTFFVYTKQDGEKTYIINGGALAFYSSKIKEIDGKKEVVELLTNFWDHISWAGIAKEGGVTLKNAKKPEKLLKQILELNTDVGDIVLDYHLGSGTTCAVAHKMKRQYIGIEQLDYGENDSLARLVNVINGDLSGISKAVNWKGGGTFVYTELAPYNEKAKEEINDCNTLEDLEKLFDTLYDKYFLNYNLKVKDFKEKIIKEDNFKALSLEEQKTMFLTMLDLNQMYVQKSEMSDKKYDIKEEYQKLTKEFYNDEN